MRWFARNTLPEIQADIEVINLLKEIREDYKHTPDARILAQRTSWNLFVYNEWQFGRRDHRTFMEPGYATFLGTAFTERPYKLYKKHLGALSYPIALGVYDTSKPKRYQILDNPARIKGELYNVKTEQYYELDRVMENGVQFKRTRVAILLAELVYRYNHALSRFETQEKIHIIPAFMYVGIPSYWNNILDGGYSCSLVRQFHIPEKRSYAQTRFGDYFRWTALEENEFK